VKKPDGLGRLLLIAVPALAEHPDRLQMFIDKGRVAARATGSLAFETRYTLNIVIQDFAGDTNQVFVPLLAWIAECQPDLLQKDGHEPFTFEAEVLSGDAVDLSIDLELTERIGVQAKPEGGFAVDHFDEPRGLDEFPGVCGVSLWQLFLREQLIAQTTDPAFPGNLPG
jgi:hypothetical protein